MNPIAANIVSQYINKNIVDGRRIMPAMDTKKICETLEKTFGEQYAEWFQDIIVTRRGVDRIRSTMPYYDENDINYSNKQFIWRWLAFILSKLPQHNYVPLRHCEYLIHHDGIIQMGVTRKTYVPIEPYLCEPEQYEAYHDCDFTANLFAMMDHFFDVVDTILQIHFGLENMKDAKTIRQTTIRKKMAEYT